MFCAKNIWKSSKINSEALVWHLTQYQWTGRSQGEITCVIPETFFVIPYDKPNFFGSIFRRKWQLGKVKKLVSVNMERPYISENFFINFEWFFFVHSRKSNSVQIRVEGQWIISDLLIHFHMYWVRWLWQFLQQIFRFLAMK